METNFDLFGTPIEEKTSLRDNFIEPPFTVLDARGGVWQGRKNKWRTLGIRSEVGRDAVAIHIGTSYNKDNDSPMSEYTSIFDPHLCEVVYKWFCPDGGKILDPFAGGSVRGVVAGHLGYEYVGIDIRPEQIESNEEQVSEILGDSGVRYICGDSDKVLGGINEKFDLVFSCPPYADLEVYSDIEGDISNMNYGDFLVAYSSIIRQSCDKLKKGGYAVFIVGEVRNPKDKNGGYYGFVPDTIKSFTDAGMTYYNEGVLVTSVGSGSLRAAKNMVSGKLVKTHQNLLCFKKV